MNERIDAPAWDHRGMGIRLTGLSIPGGFGAQWQKAEGDKDVARRVLLFLEDRRLLFGQRHREDKSHCISSALQIRAFLTEQLVLVKPKSDLFENLRAMRAACRRFIEAAGPNGSYLSYGERYGQADPFSLALGGLRSMMGIHIAILAQAYDLEVDEELASILPPQPQDDDGDLGWLPGFD
ncbi:DUF6650 family protein [Micromonospora sp. NPDC048063]